MRRRRGGSAVAAVGGALCLAVLPVFVVGALSERIGDDLRFGAGGTGAVVATFFVASGAGAVPSAMLTGRIGASSAVRLGLVLSAGAALATAVWVESFWQLLITMAVGGSVVGLVDTGGARIISDLVRDRRHGVAFGLKEASVPAASMIAGASIPAISDRLSWRAVFVAGAVAAPALSFLLPNAGAAVADRARAGPASGSRPSLVLFAAGIALAVGAATAAATFLVPATTSIADTSAGAAGTVLAVASVASIVVRVGLGLESDRRPARAPAVMVWALVLGAAGAAVLAVGGPTATVVLGAVLVLGAGWGWTGLAFVLAVRSRPDVPSSAAGVVLTGLSIGGAGGPAIYGGIASLVGYRAAWLAVVVALLAGAGLIRVWSRT